MFNGTYNGYQRGYKRTYPFDNTPYRNARFKRPAFATFRSSFRSYGRRQQTAYGGIPRKFIPRAGKPELKSLNQGGVNSTSSQAIYQTLALVSQGPTENERIGYKICWKSLLFRITLTKPYQSQASAQTAAQATTVRLLLFMDRQTNGVAATIPDIIDSVGTLEPMNLSNSHRFKILKDWIINLNPTGLGYASGPGYYLSPQVKRTLQYYTKLNIPQLYDGEGGAIENAKDYSIGFFIIPDSGNVVTYAWNSRLRYADN